MKLGFKKLVKFILIATGVVVLLNLADGFLEGFFEGYNGSDSSTEMVADTISDDEIAQYVTDSWTVDDYGFNYEPDYVYIDDSESQTTTTTVDVDNSSTGSTDTTPSETTEKPDPVTVSNQRKEFIEYALSLKGTPYVYGGKTPRPGIDCSGFVAFAARKAITVNFTGSAANMFRASKKIDSSEAEPGDLVFFSDDGSRISHVGIYLGRNGLRSVMHEGDRLFVHSASDGPETGVIVSSLDTTNYWSKHYVGIHSFLSTTKAARQKTRSGNPIKSLESSQKVFEKDKYWDDVDESWFTK